MTGLIVLDDGKKKIVSGVSVQYDPTSQVSPLGVLRTASTSVVFNRSERFNLEESIYFSSTTASGATITHDSNKCVRVMSVSSTIGSKAVRATRRYFRYVKGFPQYIIITGNFKGAVSGIRKTIGQFSENNGYFIQLDGLTPKIGIRSSITGSVVNTTISQISWDDPLDGTGDSGITIDWTKQQLFHIDYAWLGIAQVRFGVYHEGKVVIFHKINNANIIETSYSQTAVLPLRFEIENISSVSGSSMELACYSVQTDDGNTLAGSVRAASTGANELTIGTTENIVFAVRLSSLYTGNIKPIKYQVFVPSGNSTVFFRVLFNPTVTLGNGTWNTVTNSIAESLTPGTTTTFTGGVEVDNGYTSVGSTSGNRDFISDTELGKDVNLASDIICLVARTVSSNSKVLFNGVWREDT